MPGKSERIIGAYSNPDVPREWLIVTKKPKEDEPFIFFSRFTHGMTGKPFTHEEMGLQPDARDAFLAMLGRNRTSKDLAELFGLAKSTVREKLQQKEGYVSPKPEVKERPLPPWEKAFFMGLACGDFQVCQINWSSDDFVSIGTESKRQSHINVLKQTIGTWGTTHENADGIKVFLHPGTFDFLINPYADKKMLGKIFRQTRLFTPFVLGLLLGKLSELGNRVSLHDQELLNKINIRFEDIFGFRMGRFRLESRGNNQFASLTLRNPEEVFSALIQTEGVQRLSFFRSLFDTPQPVR